MLTKTSTISFCSFSSESEQASIRVAIIPTRGAKIMARFVFSWNWQARLTDLQVQI